MDNFMLQLMNMSIQASIAVVVVLIVRLLFAKLSVSKKYAILLWLVPFLSMVCPWRLESPIGLWESHSGGYQAEQVREVVISIQNAVSPLAAGSPASSPDASMYANEAGVVYSADNFPRMSGSSVPAGMPHSFWTICGGIWIVGLIAILIYSVFSYIRLRKKLICSFYVEENLYLADDIDIPFVFGFFRPQIYLPSGMEREYLQYVTEHEKAHIRRRDPMKKMAAFLITCVHWFNPFAWIAFSFFGRDMEMACDEETVEKIGIDKRKDYANALLALSAGRTGLLGAPLAFGEGDSGSRIRNILRYKRTLWITTAVAILVVVVLAVCFFTRREVESNNGEDQNVSVSGTQPNGEEENMGQTLPDEDGQNPPLASVQGEIIEITPPRLSGETICGVDGPLLDYADEKKVIFHDYYGLFVYNIETQRMTDAMDLEAIGCQYTQGDNYCEVLVEDNGTRVYLHPLSEEDMYVYDVENHELSKREYSTEGTQIFIKKKLIMDCINPDTTVLRSYQCATLTSDNAGDNRYRYLYLESGSGMAMNLCYVIGTTSEELERGRLFAEYDTSINNDILENTDIENIDVPENMDTSKNIDAVKKTYSADDMNISESMDIREDIINADEISALGGIIEVASEMTYGEFKELHWTTDIDNSLAEDARLYVVKIYYPDGFDHYKVGRIEHCEAIGLYNADTGEYLGGSFAQRQEKLR